MSQTVKYLLKKQVTDPLCTFSIGSFGAIAEFQRDPAEEAVVETDGLLAMITRRGALKIELDENTQPVAYENLSKHPKYWRNGIVICRPDADGKSRQRKTLTELGPDWSAIRPEDRSAVLFDVGVGSKNVDFCIRTHNEMLIENLRNAEGRSVLDLDNPVMEKIIVASPHRVVMSKIGRIEVYQRIPTDQTSEGPHTHLLPNLLRTGRTHSANVPVPADYLPCLSCYPANPLYDSKGNETPFDANKFQEFMAILERWGLPDYLEEKKRALDAIGQSVLPEDYLAPHTRLGRTALRVTLRQLKCQNQNSSLLDEWQLAFDSKQSQQVV